MCTHLSFFIVYDLYIFWFEIGTPSPSSTTCQSSLLWTACSGCSIVNCNSPIASTGYVLGSGSTTYGSTYSMTCAAGYTGNAASLTCQSSGSWSSQSGCTIVNCNSPVASTGYSLGSGETTYGSAYTMMCATGFTGTAASLTCQASGSWTTQSGCSIVNCRIPGSTTGYILGSGSTTYGSTYSLVCDTGYSGSPAAISCQASGSWSSPSGCTIVSCPATPTQTNYVIGSGGSTYGNFLLMSCFVNDTDVTRHRLDPDCVVRFWM
jgi:hypothetical protein